MKDKLTFKRKRINWIYVVEVLGLSEHFLEFSKQTKVKSLNKRCYNWFLSIFGRKYVKLVREDNYFYLDPQLIAEVVCYKYNLTTVEEIKQIAKVPWIIHPDED